MAEFIRQDLAGSRFYHVDLSGARFRSVDLTGATIIGSELIDVEITGEIQDVRINGVDVAPLVEAELDRRYPDRAKMRPADAAGRDDRTGHRARLSTAGELPGAPVPAGHPH
jgi:uncharacterized protein YjbI with pentapeptide repeats